MSEFRQTLRAIVERVKRSVTAIRPVLRRHRALVAVGVVATAALAAAELLVPGRPGPPAVTAAASPPAGLTHPAPLPDDRPVVTDDHGALALWAGCRQICPVYLEINHDLWYRLPAQDGPVLWNVSLSTDGRWLWYRHHGHSALRDLTSTTEYSLPAGTALAGWQPLSGWPATPIRWMAFQSANRRSVTRLDLTTGHTTTYQLGRDRSAFQAVLPSGNLLTATKTRTGSGLVLDTVDPTTGATLRQLPVATSPPASVWLGGTALLPYRAVLDPGARHAVLAEQPTRGNNGSHLLVVDLTTGTAQPVDLDAAAAASPDPTLSGTATSWTLVGFTTDPTDLTVQRTGRHDDSFDVFITITTPRTGTIAGWDNIHAQWWLLAGQTSP